MLVDDLDTAHGAAGGRFGNDENTTNDGTSAIPPFSSADACSVRKKTTRVGRLLLGAFAGDRNSSSFGLRDGTGVGGNVPVHGNEEDNHSGAHIASKKGTQRDSAVPLVRTKSAGREPKASQPAASTAIKDGPQDVIPRGGANSGHAGVRPSTDGPAGGAGHEQV